MSLWSYFTGKKGHNRVRVYERQKHGSLHIEWYERGRQQRRTLKALAGYAVYDRGLAVRLASHFAEQIANGHNTAVTDGFMERHLLAGIQDALVERFMFPEGKLFEHEVPCEPLCGVYFLLDTDDSVLYVGQSRDIMQRVSAHRQRSPFQFARCVYQPFKPEDLERAESFYIHRFQPVENVRIPPVRAGDRKLTWPENGAGLSEALL
ncbi:MAG: GIY-YIG nuclease family protein [Gemmatimonadota bacterium]